MVINGRAESFETGIKEFKENLHLVSKLLGDKVEWNETSVITHLLQKVFEERKQYQTGKGARDCEMIIKPNLVEYHMSGFSFGWTVMGNGHYEFYLSRDS